LFEQRFQIARKQTGLPDAGNNLRKSHLIMCHVAKYSTILGVFQQPWPGVSPRRHFERGEGPGDEFAYCPELYEFPWNVSANNARTVYCTDLRLGEIVYFLIFRNI